MALVHPGESAPGAAEGGVINLYILIIGLALLTGCSGGGGAEPAVQNSKTVPLVQPDMLTATPQGLLRGKADGTGQHLILALPDLQKETVLVSEGNVYYHRVVPVIAPFPLRDLWTVRTDGTGDRALVNNPAADEAPAAVSGPWVVYSSVLFEPGGTAISLDERWSVRVDTGQQVKLISNASTQLVAGIWGVFNDVGVLFPIHLDGTDEHGILLHPSFDGEESDAIIDDTLIYREVNENSGAVMLNAVKLSGGPSTSLDDGLAYTAYAGHIGLRVVTQRCEIVSTPFPHAGACDVVSVQTDGTNRVVLASEPANEAVQGITTNQVIIRRNLSGNDQLVAVPVGGGAEKLLMSMTDNEFVDLIVGDLIIVRRLSGTWSLDLNGTLTTLGTVVGDSGFIAVGDSVCVTKVTAVWCMPLDGSGPQVKIADDGKVVGVL